MTQLRRTVSTVVLALAVLTRCVPTLAQSSIFSWGYDEPYGQLGSSATSQYGITPVPVDNLTGVVSVAAGDRRSHALKADGTVWSWGYNQNGSLGIGTADTFKNVPTRVTALSNVTAIGSGWAHALAVKNDGTAWAWGDNQYGQLGDGTTTPRNAPVQVQGLTGVTKVAGGYRHSIALKGDGTVWAWGKNDVGQLGDGTTTNSSIPVQVQGLTNVVAIASGAYHNLAVKNDGTLWVWGDSYWGQLGIGINGNGPNLAYRTSPVQVTSLTGVVDVAGGYYHSLAVKSDGTVWSFGYNTGGQLGDGTFTKFRNTPVQVQGLLRVTKVSAGQYSSIAIRNDGSVWTWGGGLTLGVGRSSASALPMRVPRVGSAISVAMGDQHGLAVSDPAFNWYALTYLQNQADSNIAVLTLRGNRFTGSSSTNPKNSANRVVVATGDFNRDGNDDVVVQDSNTGAVTFLYMNGNLVTSSALLTPALGADWKVKAAADFGGGLNQSQDGWPDLVIQNTTTQQVAVVRLNGATVASTHPLSKSLLPGWQVVGAADFGGDEKMEVVVQNTSTRQVSLLSLDESENVIGSAPLLPTLPTGWTVRACADFTGDGWPDLMAQNTTTGQIAVLKVLNKQITSSYSVNPAPAAGWVVVGPK